MRLVDVVLAFPFLVLMLAIIAILGPGLASFYIAMALVGWVSYARLIRAQILVLKTQDFAVAARSLGFSRTRIMFRHLLPNAIAGCHRLRHVGRRARPAERRGDQLSRPRRAAAARPNGASWSPRARTSSPPPGGSRPSPALPSWSLAFGFSLLADGLAELLGVHE